MPPSTCLSFEQHAPPLAQLRDEWWCVFLTFTQSAVPGHSSCLLHAMCLPAHKPDRCWKMYVLSAVISCAECMTSCLSAWCAEDSVEIALEFFKVVGAYLQDVNKQGFEMCAF